MDFTNIKCISQKCKDKSITMLGAGATFSSSISIVKLKCPKCSTKIMIIPMQNNYEYEISGRLKKE